MQSTVLAEEEDERSDQNESVAIEPVRADNRVDVERFRLVVDKIEDGIEVDFALRVIIKTNPSH